jgi:hypothetical protein
MWSNQMSSSRRSAAAAVALSNRAAVALLKGGEVGVGLGDRFGIRLRLLVFGEAR